MYNGYTVKATDLITQCYSRAFESRRMRSAILAIALSALCKETLT